MPEFLTLVHLHGLKQFFFNIQFIATLEEQLSELRTSPMVPEKEILDEYTRSVAFLKGLIITEKLINI